MKVLFVCKGNVARSQMAAAIYNRLTNTNDAQSAGIEVTNNGETLGDRCTRIGASHTLTVMQEDSYDISGSKQRQLTENMLDDYDIVISMHNESRHPVWLTGSPKYVFWDVADPFGSSLDETRKTKELITNNVRAFIDSH